MQMTIKKIIKFLNGSLEYNIDYQIGRYLMKNYQIIPEYTLETLGEMSTFGSEHVLNFIKKLGFKDYNAFQNRVIADQQMHIDALQARMIHIDKDVFYRQLDTTYTKEELQQLIEKIADLVHEKERIILIGSLSPSSVAVDFQIDMISLGKEVIEYPLYDENFVFNQNDLVIFLTATGRTIENFVAQKRDKGLEDATILLVTQNIRYRNFGSVCANYVIHVLGRFDGLQFNYQLMSILDLVRISYYEKYY